MIPSLLRSSLFLRLHTTRNTTKWASHNALLFSTGTTEKNNLKNDDNTDNSNQVYLKSYKLNGTGDASKVTITTDTGHTLITDLPRKMGGSNCAPQPVETLIAAWMGCTQATALFVGRHLMMMSDDIKRGGGRRRRVSIDKLEFENIQAYRDDRGAVELPINETPGVESRLQRITGIIRVFSRGGVGADGNGGEGRLSFEQMKLLKEQTEIRCPIANMIISSGCSIDVEWIDASESGRA